MNRIKKLALNCDAQEIQDAPEPKEILLPLPGEITHRDRLRFRQGRPVLTGQELKSGLYSTATGTIKGIETLLTLDGEIGAIRIELAEEEKLDPTIQKIPNFLEEKPQSLLNILNRANFGLHDDIGDVDTVIVSAVDVEPMATVRQQILRMNTDALRQGLKMVLHLSRANRVILAIPENLHSIGSEVAQGLADIFVVEPYYPNGFPQILTDKISSKYHLERSVFVGVEKLVSSVLCLLEGRPNVYKAVSIVGKNETRNTRVRIGTPLKEVLVDEYIYDDDKIIIGGPMTGQACHTLEFPVMDDVDLLYVQDSTEIVRNPNTQCINCGKCVKVCPADLAVNLLGRYAEFAIFENCDELRVQYCIECGLCAYVCPAGRSLVQLMRFAKSEIEKIKAKELEMECEDKLEEETVEQKEG